MKNLRPRLFTIVGFVFVLFLGIGCKKEQPNFINEDTTEEWVEYKEPKYKIVLETDYPYYFIICKSSENKVLVKENLRMQKYWEKELSAKSGDSISIEVNTINSNIPGTYLKIKILRNDQLVSSKEYIKTPEENCINDCPLSNDAVNLNSTFTVK